MYQEHFGLERAPFSLIPDPAFLYLGEQYSSAKAFLESSAFVQDSFIVITGEIGAGKTTLVEGYLCELPDDETVIARINQTQLSPTGFLRMLLDEFGLDAFKAKKPELLSRFRKFMAKLARDGRRAVVVIDEAQNLSREVLEEIRMLTCGEHAASLSVVLVGQPEFLRTLESPELEQLAQRCRLRSHLIALDENETFEYIEHRVRVAGGDPDRLFSEDAIHEIFAATGGIPRLINSLCDTALICAFADELEQVDAAEVHAATRELRWHRGKTTAKPAAGTTRRRRASGTSRNGDKDTALEASKARIAELERELQAARRALAKTDDSSRPAAVMDAGQVADLAAMLAEREQRLNELQQEFEGLADSGSTAASDGEEQLASGSEALDEILDQTEALMAALESAREARETKSDEDTDVRAQLDEARRDHDAALELMEDLQAALADKDRTVSELEGALQQAGLTADEARQSAQDALERDQEDHQNTLREKQEQISSLEDKLARVNESVTALEEEIAGQRSRNEALEEEKARLEERAAGQSSEDARLNALLDERNDALESLQSALSRQSDETERLEAALAASEEEVAGLEAKLASGSEAAASLGEILEQKNDLVAGLEQELEARQGFTESLEASLAEKESELDEIASQLSEAQQRIEVLTAEVGQKDETLAAHEDTIESLQSELQEKTAALAASEDLTTALKKQLEDLEESGNELQQELARERETNASLEAAIAEKAAALDSAGQGLAKSHVRVAELEQTGKDQAATIATLEEQSSSLSAALEDSREEARQLGDQLTSAETAREQAEDALADMQARIDGRDNSIATLEQEVRRKSQLIDELHDKLAPLPDLEEKLAQQLSRIEQLEGELAERDRRIFALQDSVASGVQALEEARREAEAASDGHVNLHREIGELKAQVTTLTEDARGKDDLMQSLQTECQNRKTDLRRLRQELDETLDQARELRDSVEVGEARSRQLESELSAAMETISELSEGSVGVSSETEKWRLDAAAKRREADDLREKLDEKARVIAKLEDRLREKSETIKVLQLDGERDQDDEDGSAVQSDDEALVLQLRGEVDARDQHIEELTQQLRDNEQALSGARRELEQQSALKRSLESQLDSSLKAAARLRDELGKADKEFNRTAVLEDGTFREGPRAADENKAAEAGEVRRETTTQAGLVVTANGQPARKVALSGERLIIGRTRDSDVKIDNEFASRHHAQIILENGRYVLEDLNSTNGILVNSQKVTRRELQNHDVIRIGKDKMVFVLEEHTRQGEKAALKRA